MATKTQIAQWKEIHGEVLELSVVKDGETISACFRPISIQDLEIAELSESMIARIIKFFDLCCLCNNPQVVNNDQIKLAMAKQLNFSFQDYEVSVKKL